MKFPANIKLSSTKNTWSACVIGIFLDNIIFLSRVMQSLGLILEEHKFNLVFYLLCSKL